MQNGGHLISVVIAGLLLIGFARLFALWIASRFDRRPYQPSSVWPSALQGDQPSLPEGMKAAAGVGEGGWSPESRATAFNSSHFQSSSSHGGNKEASKR